MSLAVFLALVITAVGVVLCVLSIARLRRGQTTLARRYAKYSALASVAFLPIITTAAVGAAVSGTGPESKATYLARGIADAMNTGAVNIPVGLTSLVVWIVARRRETNADR